MYKKDPLLPTVTGDSNNKDDKGRVKVLKSQIRGQAFLGSKVNFYDIAEEKDFLANISEFTSDGAYAYLVVQEDF
jgi:hypothetical protein